MTRLPVVSARDAIKAFGRAGYQVDHQSGSHVVLRQSQAPHRRLTVPNHSEIAKGTLRALIREAGLTVEVTTHAGCQAQHWNGSSSPIRGVASCRGKRRRRAKRPSVKCGSMMRGG